MASTLVAVNDQIQTCECLNQQSDHTAQSMLAGTGYVASDCDEQLLFNVAFVNPQRLARVEFRSAPAISKGGLPKTVKFYANQKMLFDHTQQVKPTDAAELRWAEPADGGDGTQVAVVNLTLLRWINTRMITVFVEDNEAGLDVTALGGLRFFGEASKTVGGQGELKKSG